MCEVLDKVEKRGEVRGQQKFADALKSLKSCLVADNKIDEFIEAATNVNFAEKLFKKYGIPY